MNKEVLKKKIFKNRYLDFAYNRYLSFKETPQYDEHYKLETLEKLNGYFRKTELLSKRSLIQQRKFKVVI